MDKLPPTHYGVPHEKWRENQWKGFVEAKRILEEGEKKFIFAELPTGSGKTSLASALAHYRPVTAHVGTLNLLDQYVREYNFVGIKGRENYPCVLESKLQSWDRLPTAADCHYNPMEKCDESKNCPYLIQKKRALGSERAIVTYAYGSLSENIQGRPGILVLDEGHASADRMLKFAEFEITDQMVERYNLNPFDDRLGGCQEVIVGKVEKLVWRYLSDCVYELEKQIDTMDRQSREYSRYMDFYQSMVKVEENLFGSHWFLDCDQGRFTLKPMDASPLAKRLWAGKDLVLLMSATIGDPKPLADMLGIDLKTAEHLVYDHPVPVEYRPVYDLGVKKMTWENLQQYPNLYQVQAATIAGFIDTLPQVWRGIILTSSFDKIDRLAVGLRRFVTGRRLIVQSRGIKIDELTHQFLEDREKGDLLIASIQGFGEGIDLKKELARFAVIAGVPFDNPTDPYIQAMQNFPGGRGYLWYKAYSAVPQAAGRVSRATKVDNGDWRLNVAAIADGSATTDLAMKHYPQYFKDAIREF